MHVCKKSPWSLFPVPSTHTVIGITSINPALPCGTARQIMQNRVYCICVCACVCMHAASAEHIPVVLIESCFTDCKRRSMRFIHSHTLIYTFTQAHAHAAGLLTPSYTHSQICTHLPTPEERFYWIETVGRPLSHRPVWCTAKLSLPTVSHHMYVWAE